PFIPAAVFFCLSFYCGSTLRMMVTHKPPQPWPRCSSFAARSSLTRGHGDSAWERNIETVIEAWPGHLGDKERMNIRKWLVEILRMLRLLRVPREPKSSREMVFPDSGVRRDTPDLLGSFDPFNLLVCAQSPPDQATEHGFLMRGELEKARALA